VLHTIWNFVHRKIRNKTVHNGTFTDEKTAAYASDTLARKLMASGVQNLRLNFPHSRTDITSAENKTSKYVGVYYEETKARWRASRRSKNKRKLENNGSYRDEETAAHASDTLARKLMKNGEQSLRLNFPEDGTEVYPEQRRTSSKYIGVSYRKREASWRAQRWSKHENKTSYRGYHNDEEAAARASDALAQNHEIDGDQNYKLNFPDESNKEQFNNHTESHRRARTSKFFGVSYNEKAKRWIVQRWNKMEKKLFSNGYYKNEQTAAHASDTLARRLKADGKENFKLNFPDVEAEARLEHQKNKRKRPVDCEYIEADEDSFEKFENEKSENSPKFCAVLSSRVKNN
jgi:hypothetical protein